MLNNDDNCHFIEIGQIITLEAKRYKVTNIAFRLDAIHHGIGMYVGVDLFNQEPQDANCQISVFVEPVD